MERIIQGGGRSEVGASCNSTCQLPGSNGCASAGLPASPTSSPRLQGLFLPPKAAAPVDFIEWDGADCLDSFACCQPHRSLLKQGPQLRRTRDQGALPRVPDTRRIRVRCVHYLDCCFAAIRDLDEKKQLQPRDSISLGSRRIGVGWFRCAGGRTDNNHNGGDLGRNCGRGG